MNRRHFVNSAVALAGALTVRRLGAQTTTPPHGKINTVLGGGALGNGLPAGEIAMSSPFGVSIDSFDNLYVCDNYYHRIYKVISGATTFTTIAGSGIPGFAGDGGPGTSASLNYPYGVAAFGSQYVYIADTDNNRIRRFDQTTGVINTQAGLSKPGYNGDRIPAYTAQLNTPHGVAVDAAGNVYIADSGNNRLRVINLGTQPMAFYPQSSSPVTVAPGNIATLCGNGTAGFAGDGGPAVRCMLNIPWGVGLDRNGDLYIADYYNQRVRKVNMATGIVNTVAGVGIPGNTGDGGPASRAAISYPCSVAFDSSNNLYIGQEQTSTIRRVWASTQTISTIAGKGGSGDGGDGGPAINALMSSPTGVCIDSRNNLYAADYNNGRVRLIVSSSHIITTYAGSTNFGNEGPALEATLNEPCGLSFTANGRLVLADECNSEVRIVQ